MAKHVVLVTGANGEIGRALLQELARGSESEIVALDLTPLHDAMSDCVAASYTGNIVDKSLLDQLAAQHEMDKIFHLAALLSTRGERDPELSHRVNVEGTLNVLRMAQNQSSRLGRPVQVLFPSSIAVYGLPSLAEKRSVGRIREDQWNAPITMYGCNKLYCEHLGRYFTYHARQLGALSGATRLDFRAVRFPGLISADTLPMGGTSDFGPEMIHAAARGHSYSCFVEPETRIPFMAMPDAVRALVELARADSSRLTTRVYNVGAFNPSAEEIAKRVHEAFPRSRIDYAPDAARSRIVASWPEDVDDARARADWGWHPLYDWRRAFDEYLFPTIDARSRR
ncbi:MAG TPA: NAD-dependent epimerase/dehydratase family protein [Polyangiaceae bacterium]|nr:NAD-dependent epimerase/dehydratase family protein [Polyangiaceae bacterium]